MKKYVFYPLLISETLQNRPIGFYGSLVDRTVSFLMIFSDLERRDPTSPFLGVYPSSDFFTNSNGLKTFLADIRISRIYTEN